MRPLIALAMPKDMHFIKSRLNREHVIDRHISAHRFIVDIVTQTIGNFCT